MLNKNFERGDIANSIVLHDFVRPSPDEIKNWLEYIVEYFRVLDIAPTRIGITGDAYTKSKKTILFKNGAKKLYEKNFNSIDALSISAWDKNDDNIVFTWLHLDEVIQKNSMILSCDDNLACFTQKILLEFIKNSIKFLKPRYGYCYQRKWENGPYWYPFGIIGGNGEILEEEEESITKWSHKYSINNKYKTGDLRDIYPMNIICNKHLKRNVGSQTLKDWIESDPKHGKLESFNKDTYAWWVDTENIDYVREKLRSTGMILCI